MTYRAHGDLCMRWSLWWSKPRKIRGTREGVGKKKKSTGDLEHVKLVEDPGADCTRLGSQEADQAIVDEISMASIEKST